MNNLIDDLILLDGYPGYYRENLEDGGVPLPQASGGVKVDITSEFKIEENVNSAGGTKGALDVKVNVKKNEEGKLEIVVVVNVHVKVQ